MPENQPVVDAWVIGRHYIPLYLRPLTETAPKGSVLVRDNDNDQAIVLSPEAFKADYEWV